MVSANTQLASVAEKTISGVHVSPCSAETLVRRSGIKNHYSIASFLRNISTKNYQHRFMCVEVIVRNISVVFLRHNVCLCICRWTSATQSVLCPSVTIHCQPHWPAANSAVLSRRNGTSSDWICRKMPFSGGVCLWFLTDQPSLLKIFYVWLIPWRRAFGNILNCTAYFCAIFPCPLR